MPYIIATAWIPLNKANDLAKKYIEERQKNPPDRSLGKEILQGAIKAVRGRIKTMSITDVKEGKLEEALLRTQNDFIPFHELEGYEYKIEVYFNLGEAMGMLGMKPPE